MDEKIVLSGVPHAVQTNERTKNAINPRNAFVEHDVKPRDDIADAFASLQTPSVRAPESPETHESTPTSRDDPSYPSLHERYDTRQALTVAKAHITTHLEKLNLEKPADHQIFFESLHKIEERIQKLRLKHPSNNLQHIEENVVADNFQHVESRNSQRDRMSYKEKKNIHENLQSVTEHPVGRELPDLASTAEALAPVDRQEEALSAQDVHGLLDGALDAFNEEELRARVRAMKEKLSKANQSLKDIENNP